MPTVRGDIAGAPQAVRRGTVFFCDMGLVESRIVKEGRDLHMNTSQAEANEHYW